MTKPSPLHESTHLRALLGWAALVGVGLALLLAAGRPAAAGAGQAALTLDRAAGALPSGTPVRPALQPAAGIARHQVVATIPLTPGIGLYPSAIAADPHSPLVYVANEGSSDITVLSGTRALGRVSAMHEGIHDGVGMLLAADPTTGHLYALETTGARCTGPVQTFYLQEISATQVITTAYLGGCPLERRGCSADAMAVQPTTGYLYLLRTYTVLPYPPRGTITILDGATVLDEISLENYSPSDVAADPAQGWVYVTSGYSNVLVLSGTAVVGTAPVTAAAAIAVQPRTGLAYVVSQEDHLAVVSGTTVLDRFQVGRVADLAADPARGYLYVSHPTTPTLTVVSGTAVLTDVLVPSPGGEIEVNAATGLVYMRHPDTAQMTVLSGTAVLTTVEVLSGSMPLASSPFTGLVYAVDGANSVAVLSGTQRLGALPPAAPRPRALAAHSTNGQVVMLSDPPILSWIEGEAIVATVALTAAPNQMLLHPTSGLVYLALPDERQVQVLSGTTPLAAVPLAGPPVQLAVGPGGGPVYVADDAGTLTVVSGTAALAALPLGAYGLAGVAVHPGSGWAYATDPWADRVHVVSGTAVLTDVVVGSYPRAIAAEPGSGYVYVEAGAEGLEVISGTDVIAAVALGAWDLIGLYPAPAGGLLYVHERGSSPYNQCDRIAVYRGTEEVAVWALPEGARYAALAFHPWLSPVYAGHGVYGSLLTIGAGALQGETIAVGDGGWVRAVAVLPSGRVYAATDHEITILEPQAPYRFYLPFVRRDPPPPPPAPPAAGYCNMVYDPDRRVVRMYVSADAWSPSPAWEYDGLAWQPLLTAAFPDLDWGGHALAHDRARGVTLLGGLRENYYGDLWAYDSAAWTRVNYYPLYTYSAMAYDPLRGRTVAFGGKWCERPGCAYFDRTWEYDGFAWSEVEPAHAPAARSNHALAYDGAAQSVLLFGGGAAGELYSDTWAYDGVDWRLLTPTVSPPPRAGHALAYDAARGVTVLFGGYGVGYLGDTWEYDGLTWRPTAPAASPPPRSGHAMAYDEARGVIVLYGGMDADRSYEDTWEYDGVNWRQVQGAR